MTIHHLIHMVVSGNGNQHDHVIVIGVTDNSPTTIAQFANHFYT